MKIDKHSMKTENLAYWFFRLNGCLCLVNFLVHHERRGQEGTDVDILAVRFPFRSELAYSDKPMDDHPVFESNGKTDLIITEVKLGQCDLNGPWTDPDKKNMQRVLFGIGAFNQDQNELVARALYEKQFYEDDYYRFRLFAIGKNKNPSLPAFVIQMTWDEVLRFIHKRFTTYRYQKRQHRQWDYTGRRLFRMADKLHRDRDEFVENIANNLIA